MRRNLRLLGVAWLLNVKQLTRSSFDGFLAIAWPIFFAMFAMAQAIAGERSQQTLAYLLVSPARRLPLFLGRALPVVANALFVALFSLLVAGLVLRIDVPVETWPAIALVVFVAIFSCTGLGLICAGVGLRVRETAVLNNVIFGLLLIFTGANVDIDELPGWMQAISERVPLTHGIEAARRVADGASVGEVSGLLAREAVIGIAYTIAGYALLRLMERESRRRASLQVA